MKDYIKRFISSGLQGLAKSFDRWQLAVILGGALLLAGAAGAQPVNDNFAGATVISGQLGTLSDNNSGATMEATEPSIVTADDEGPGPVDVTNSVWFVWTAPQSGNVTFDTMGSEDYMFNGMDTVLGVWTGTSVDSLIPVAGDDNAFAGFPTNSSVTFLAVAGTTYHIGLYLNADSGGLPGTFVLNWHQQGAPSGGTFGFTAPSYVYSQNESTGPLDNRGKMGSREARATITRTGGGDGAVEVSYTAYQTLYTNMITTNLYVLESDVTLTDTNGVLLGITNITTTVQDIIVSYQNYNGSYYTRTYPYANLIVVTNRNGFPGFPLFSNNIPYILNVPNPFGFPSGSLATNGDVVTFTTNTLTITNLTSTNYLTSYTGQYIDAADLGTVLTDGSLVVADAVATFPDFEMNVDISVPAPINASPNLVNPALYIKLNSADLDFLEDPNLVAPPGLGSVTNTAITFLSPDGADMLTGPYGLGPAGTNDFLFGNQANTNMIANFERSTLTCDKTVLNSGVAKVYITLSRLIGTTPVTIYYRTDHTKDNDDNHSFTLQAGSDYARPDNATKFTASTDFTSQLGSVTFVPDGDLSQAINIPISQDSEVKFDRDMKLDLYWPPNTMHTAQIGNINTLDLTILFTTPPAGAVDCSYDPENNSHNSFISQPGANGEVFAAVVQPGNDKAIIGGNFTGYANNNDSQRNYVARINVDGSLDSGFGTKDSGVDGTVRGLALDTNGEVVVVGNFHSSEGFLRNGVARLNTDGSLDETFDPGDGTDGSVACVAIQPDGKILIGGLFTMYDNTPIGGVARLNTDGTLDTSFTPPTGLNGEVSAIAISTNDGSIYIGGGFTNLAGGNLSYIAGLNTNGSLNASFNSVLGSGMNGAVFALVVQPDGQILAGGDFTLLNGQPIGQAIVRLGANGALDTSFNVGTGADDAVNALALQPDGSVLVGGVFRHINQTRRLGIARLLPNGWVDTSFMDTAYNQYAGLPNFYYNPAINTANPVNAVAVQSDGGVIIGGLFDIVGGDGNPQTSSATVSHLRNTAHPRSNEARLIGGTTPGPGNIGLVFTNYTANASSPAFFVNLTRTNGSLGTVAATFEAIPQGVGPGYASYGVDYTLNTTIATWGTTYANTWMLEDGLFGPNNLEKGIDGSTHGNATPITLNIISNNVPSNPTLNIGVTQPQGMDTFFLGGENIPLGVALGNPVAPMTIVRKVPNPGVFNLSQAYYSVAENGVNITITVTRTGGTDNQVRVNCITGDGTAHSGTDYTFTSKTLTFADGSATATTTFLVPITFGTLARPDRFFNVSINTPTGGAILGSVTNAVVEIINNNITSGFAEFINGIPAAPNTMGYGTNETAGAAVLTVARLAGTTGTLKVDVATANASAFSGTNYVGVTNTLVWADGDASLKTVTIPVLDDNVVTSNLTVNVRLYNALYNNLSTTNLLGIYTNAIVTITNVDSAGTVEFTAPSYIVNEGAGYAIIPVIRTGGSTGPLSVSYSNMDGTASAALNYGAVSGTLQFAAGQVSTNFIVAITNLNTTTLAPLTFYLVLNNVNPTNGLGTPGITQVNIDGSQAYNNPPGQPDSGFVGSFNSPVLALALQADGKLVAGGSFTQADGVARRRIARLKTDGSLDLSFSSTLPTSGANDAVNALLYEPNGLIVVAGLFTNFNSTTFKHIVRLNVNGSLDNTFTPGAGANNSIFALAQGSVQGQRRILVGGSFTTYNGVSRSAIAQLLDNGTLDTSFNPGTGFNGTVYALAVQSDGRILVGGDFTTYKGVTNLYLMRLNPDGSVDGSFSTGAGPNSGVRALSIEADGRILAGGTFTNFNGATANHLVRLNAGGSLDNTFVLGAGGDGNVDTIAVQPDTRIIVGGDFTHFNGVARNRITRLNPDGTTDVSINFGSGADGSVLASVIQSDGKIDLGGSFQNYDNAPHSGIVRIYGGSVAGTGVFQFSSANYSVDERGAFVTITVLRVGGAAGTGPGATNAVVIPFTTSDGSAKADTDHAGVTNYTAISANLIFPGEVVQTVAIPVFDDNIITSNLTVNLSITNAPPGLLGGQSLATLTIINDDSSINFTSLGYSVSKDVVGGQALIGIQRVGGVSGTSTVVFYATNGTAVPTTDYTPVGPVTVTFAPGITNVVTPVPINNNGLSEGNLTVNLQLTNATGSTLSSPSNAVLTIIDNTTLPGQLRFNTAGGLANATDGDVSITIIRTNGTFGNASASYYTVPGTAVPNVNYIPVVSGPVSIGNGLSSTTVKVHVLNNGLATGPVTVYVVLTNAVGATLTDPTTYLLTIVNTNVVIGFTMLTNTFSETAGVVPVTVARYNNTNVTSTIQWATADGTALSNVNYQATSGTLTFLPGESSKVIGVTLLHDTNFTGTLGFYVNLFNPGLGVQIAAPNPTVVQITDADAGISFTSSQLSTTKNSGSIQVAVVCLATNLEPVIVDSNTVPLSVNYLTANGTAVAGTDYTPVSGTLVFTNGNVTNYFSVPILNNGFTSGDKTFSVILANPTPPGVLTPPSTATVTIVDVNSGMSFSSAAYSVNKSVGIATITVLRTDNTNITSSVDYIATNGTAQSPLNFTLTSGTLVFTNGVTSQSFQVPINDTTTPQPDLTVLLRLWNPTNGILVPPSAAILTIHDDAGSYVVPAGSTLVSETGAGAPNGVIDLNETVTLQFAFRVAGGTNLFNLVAKIITNANVTAASPLTNSYGPLAYRGHSASRPFTFMAKGTNSQQISANFNLYEVTTNNPIGTAVFGYTMGMMTNSFTNSAVIVINDPTNSSPAAASPYPSVITVSGAGGSLMKATVTLNKFYHASPNDVDALVVSPAGLSTLIMAKVGGQVPVTNLMLNFDDAATSVLTHGSSAVTGTNKPSVFVAPTRFP